MKESFHMPNEEIDEIEVIDLEEYAGSDRPLPIHVKYYRIRVDEEKILVKSPISTNAILIAAGLDPEDYLLVQKIKGGEGIQLEANQLIDLRANGVERFETVLVQSITIIVNARQKTVSAKHLSFMDVLKLAFDPVPSGPNWEFTVAYRRGPKKNPEGNMTEGQTVRIKKGMVFNATATDKS